MRTKWACTWVIVLGPALYGGDLDVAADDTCHGTTSPGPRPRCIALDAASVRNSTLTASDIVALMPDKYEVKGHLSSATFGVARSRPELPHAYFTASDVSGTGGVYKSSVGWDNYTRLAGALDPPQQPDLPEKSSQLYVFSLRSTERVESVQKLFEAVDVPGNPAAEASTQTSRTVIGALVALGCFGTMWFWLYVRKR